MSPQPHQVAVVELATATPTHRRRRLERLLRNGHTAIINHPHHVALKTNPEPQTRTTAALDEFSKGNRPTSTRAGNQRHVVGLGRLFDGPGHSPTKAPAWLIVNPLVRSSAPIWVRSTTSTGGGLGDVDAPFWVLISAGPVRRPTVTSPAWAATRTLAAWFGSRIDSRLDGHIQWCPHRPLQPEPTPSRARQTAPFTQGSVRSASPSSQLRG